ncbi:MAG: hypothetical protein AB1758_07295 [Candidatus Eremiobacterota bacterium]
MGEVEPGGPSVNLTMRWLWGLWLTVLLSGPLSADSWAPPTAREVASPGGHCILTLSPEGQAALYRNGPDGRERLWLADLGMVPVEVVVADDGTAVAALDQWGGTGYGVVLGLYGPTGSRVAGHSLQDLGLASEPFVRSVSSIHWRQDAWLDPAARTVVLVTASDRMLEVGLTDGEVRPLGRVGGAGAASGGMEVFPGLPVVVPVEPGPPSRSAMFDSPSTDAPARLRLAGQLALEGDRRGGDLLLSVARAGAPEDRLYAVWHFPEQFGPQAAETLAPLLQLEGVREALKLATGRDLGEDARGWLDLLRPRPDR